MEVFLDFETRSSAKLPVVGAWRYSLDPSTEVLCLAYAFGEREPHIWIKGQQPPKLLMEAITNEARIHGWDSMSFERAIFENIAGPKLGWVTPKPEQYYDTMLDALALALPASLRDCAPALGASNQKMVEGKKLIQRLCKPISSGKKKGLFRRREEFHSDFVQLYAYCKQDVRTEREIYHKLPRKVTGQERRLQLLTMVVNERGLPMDLEAVDAIHEAVESEKVLLLEKYTDITGIINTGRNTFIEWCSDQGVALPDAKAETIADTLESSSLPIHVREAIELRKAITKTSNAKYAKIKTMICPDGTIKNNLIYHKANTGRYAGAGFQGQNLPGLTLESPEVFIQCFLDRQLDFIRIFYGVLTAASGLIRGMIKAPPGMKFLSGDLKGIEARDTAWVAGEENILNNIRNGGIGPYRTTAADMYGVTPQQVTKEQRSAGKISVLAGGFGGGYRALINMSNKYRMHIPDKLAKQYIRDFRKARPKLIAMWATFGDAAKQAVNYPGYKVAIGTNGLFSFIQEANFLYMVLPSGRRIAFPNPRIEEEDFFGRPQWNVTAEWTDSYTRKWSRRSITGPNFFQSAVQASARDVLTESHLRIEEAGLPLILSVHDEGLSLVPDDDRYTTKLYDKLMCVPPSWSTGLPIESDCWEGKRFRK